jgi:hypothetical protein
MMARELKENVLSNQRAAQGMGTKSVAVGVALLGLAALQGVRALAQDAETAALPDSPGYSSSVGTAESADGGVGQTISQSREHASHHFDKVIQPGQTAQHLTVPDKVLLGFRENATLTSVGGWVLSATYEQIVNGSPNYGQTGKGYAQRLGAAAARNVSENVFSDSVIAPILHEDPRFYRMGPGHNFIKRLVYSGTRGIITKTDGGRQTINFANIGGDLAGSAVTQLYYPSGNRNFSQVMSTWGGSIGGDAVGYVLNEFLPGGLTSLHRKSN